jgi:FkbM family methyltransferase
VEAVTAHTALDNFSVIPEIVKIDVQGGELEVLEGFGPLLSSVICCELEVSFMRGYAQQPLFNEILIL